MRKTAIALACAATLLLTGASVWEGSAIVAGAGELPESGYYVATNSFPRNTIVDVKNLETDKTVRAIVAGSLNSPGLLAALSPEAASAIGLARRTVGRIRVTVPADPIAFSRFTDGLSASEDPDRNPRAAVAATQAAVPAEAAAAAPAVPAPSPAATAARSVPDSADSAVATPPQSAQAAIPSGPIVKAESVQKAEEPSKEEQIIDVPENYVPPAPSVAVVAAVSPETPAAAASEAPAEPEENLKPEAIAPAADMPAAESTPAELAEPEAAVAEAPQATAAPEAPIAAEPAVTVVAEPAAPAIPEEAPAPMIAAPTVPEPVPVEEPLPPPPQPGVDVVLDLRPAEERPPKIPETSLSPEAFVEPAAAPAENVAEAAPVPVLTPDLFVPPLPAPAAEKLPQQEPSISIAAAAPEAPEPAAAPKEPKAEPAQASAALALPIIEKLEKGKYYVQVGAYADTTAVNETVAKLGKGFPAAVETGGNPEKPVYRVFVGPVNQGESGALLMRFKRGGYPDAFVKKGN
jgi:hypothetical protein